LSSLEAAEKVVYLTVQDFNEKWAERKLRGFAEAQEALERMFECKLAHYFRIPFSNYFGRIRK